MEKRFQKICQIMYIITNFLADPAWEVYILGELCYTKTTMKASAPLICTDVSDRVTGRLCGLL